MDGSTMAMFIFQTIITAIVGIAAWGMKNAIGEIKGAVGELKSDNSENAKKIAEVDSRLAELKADLPLLYVTREDFIRVTDNIDRKLDRLISFGQKRED